MADVLGWLRQALGGSATPEMAPGASWEAMQQGTAGTQTPPGVLNYLQDMITGKIAASGPAGQNAAYDPNRSFRENALRPDGLEAAMSMVGPAAIRAYHASPYLFDQFTLNNLRGGTGGLAQGRGLYFAQKEPVSLDYKRQFQERGTLEGPADNPLSTIQSAIERSANNQMGVTQWPSASSIAGDIVASLRGGEDLAHFRQFVKQSDWGQVEKNMWLAGLDAAQPWKYKPGPAHMYEVDIHADPNRLLNYDVPLNAQTPEVMRSLEQIPWAQDYLKSGVIKGEGVIPKTAEGAQQFNDVGIPGWKYLDQLSRNLPDAAARARMQERVASLERSLDPANPYSQPMTIGEIERLKRELAQQPTHNYVISDPERTRIEILRKYGLLPPLAVGAGGGLLGEE